MKKKEDMRARMKKNIWQNRMGCRFFFVRRGRKQKKQKKEEGKSEKGLKKLLRMRRALVLVACCCLDLDIVTFIP